MIKKNLKASVNDEIDLAVEIIRQLENLAYSPESILNTIMIVLNDTLKKMPNEQKERYKSTLTKQLKNT